MAGGRALLSPEEKRQREQERAKKKQECKGCGKELGKTQLWMHKNGVVRCGSRSSSSYGQ